jgi:hypothetical protein
MVSEIESSDATLSTNPQDPLPEPSWFWRRWFIITVTLALFVLRFFAIRMPAAQKDVAGLDALIGLVIVCYLVAPSAEQAIKMLAIAWALRSGVQFRAASLAQNGNGRTSSAVIAGKGAPAGDLAQTLPSVWPDLDDPAHRPREDD